MALSDKALSVFAFAAYHQLESGQKVSRVVRRDGAGHRADPEAVAELEQAGLIEATPDALVLRPQAEAMVEAGIAALRRALAGS
ncbi:hypothetical protein [Methylobacterium sp.]|uniref:hypothetical protein n=1 Tax=Methylobacterium sp. TaxID=409 RepID=UPI002582D8CF|nr:hypothetical protein [Methylobacterium sp.]